MKMDIFRLNWTNRCHLVQANGYAQVTHDEIFKLNDPNLFNLLFLHGIGETFARNAMFLVASALIQNFNFVKPENGHIPSPAETHTGLARMTPPYWIKFVPR